MGTFFTAHRIAVSLYFVGLLPWFVEVIGLSKAQSIGQKAGVVGGFAAVGLGFIFLGFEKIGPLGGSIIRWATSSDKPTQRPDLLILRDPTFVDKPVSSGGFQVDTLIERTKAIIAATASVVLTVFIILLVVWLVFGGTSSLLTEPNVAKKTKLVGLLVMVLGLVIDFQWG